MATKKSTAAQAVSNIAPTGDHIQQRINAIRDEALSAQATLGGAMLIVEQVEGGSSAQDFSLLAAVSACLDKIGQQLTSIVDFAEAGDRSAA